MFNLSVLRGGVSLGSTGDVALTSTDAYNEAGALGLRFFRSGSGITFTVDNFSAVPEPSSLALVGTGLLLIARRKSAN